jgi:two-component system response regulator RstA
MNSEDGKGSDPLIHVLLVEDDARLASLTREYLERHGIAVSVAHDGESGLREARAHRFDAVLLDLMLPGIGGMEVCRRIRERSDVPIVMVTARVEEADRVMGLEGGADDYVPKPFSPRELLARVRAVVRRARGGSGPGSAGGAGGPRWIGSRRDRIAALSA